MNESPSKHRAFTLNELLIVIAIIVLMIGLAVPAFNVLTGSRSIESAQNQISAVLGQARTEAIGLQETRGVMFFFDIRTDRINLAMVRDTGIDLSDDATYLDLVPDRDFVALPPGVLVQTVDSCVVNGSGVRTDDGYFGFNTLRSSSSAPAVNFPYGGVILFDGSGRLRNVRYGFRSSYPNPNPPPAGQVYTNIASLFENGDMSTAATASTAADFVPGGAATVETFSQLGLVLFDRAAFSGAGHTLDDGHFAASPTYSTAEAEEETWLDQNGALLLVNRYNGTLVKGD